MKYIMVGFTYPVLFSNEIQHSTEAAGRKCSSAGFVRIVDGKADVFGSSISLGLEPQPEDAALIDLLLKDKL